MPVRERSEERFSRAQQYCMLVSEVDSFGRSRIEKRGERGENSGDDSDNRASASGISIASQLQSDAMTACIPHMWLRG
jgi:hypothetical protein